LREWAEFRTSLLSSGLTAKKGSWAAPAGESGENLLAKCSQDPADRQRADNIPEHAAL
jgi:hypothetical protein